MSRRNIANYALRVDDRFCGESLHAIFLSEVAPFRIIDVDPWKFIFLYPGKPCVFCLATIHAHYFKTVFVFRICLLQLRESFDAPYAPASPKIEDYPLPLELGKADMFAGYIFKGEIRGGGVALSHFRLFPFLFLAFLKVVVLTLGDGIENRGLRSL